MQQACVTVAARVRTALSSAFMLAPSDAPPLTAPQPLALLFPREFLQRKFAGLVEVTVQSASSLPAADVSAAWFVVHEGLDAHQGGTTLPAAACCRKGKSSLVPPASSPNPVPPAVVALLQKRPLRCRQHWRLGGSHLGDQPGAQPAVGRVLLPVCPVSTCNQPVNVHALLVWSCALRAGCTPHGACLEAGSLLLGTGPTPACNKGSPPARNSHLFRCLLATWLHSRLLSVQGLGEPAADGACVGC